MNPENESNQMHDMMTSDYNDQKFSKEKELNDSMSIQNQSPDELENNMHNIGGNQ